MFGTIFKAVSATVKVPAAMVKDTCEVVCDKKIKHDAPSNTDKAVDNFIDTFTGKK